MAKMKTCPRRTYIENLSRRAKLLLTIAVSFSLFACILVAVLGPARTQTTTGKWVSKCGENELDLYADSCSNCTISHFAVRLNEMSNQHQQLQLKLSHQIQHNSKEDVFFPVRVNVHAYGLYGNGKVKEIVHKKTHDITVDCVYESGGHRCKPYKVFSDNLVGFPKYDLRVYLNNMRPDKGIKLCEDDLPTQDTTMPANTSGWPVVVDLEFVSKTFTKFELSLRFVFLSLSSIVVMNFFKMTKSTSHHQRAAEQRWIRKLLILLWLFNDPFVFLQLFRANFSISMLHLVFSVTFFSVLLLFWLWLYGFIAESRKCDTLPFQSHSTSKTTQKSYIEIVFQKLAFIRSNEILVFGLWIFIVPTIISIKIEERRDPMYDYSLDFKGFDSVKSGTSFFIFLYSILSIFLVWQAFTVYSSISFVHKFALWTSLFAFLVVFSYLLFFVTTDSIPNRDSLFLAIQGILNVYIAVLSITFTPASLSQKDSSQHVLLMEP